MAILKMPFIYRLVQSMGDNTYYYSRGQSIMRVKVDKNSSNTPKQQRQRLKMAMLGKLSSVLYDAVDIGFPQRSIRFTAGNAFVSANKDAVVVDESLDISINYEQLAVAKGNLQAPEDATVKAGEEEHTLVFEYAEEEYGRRAEKTDVVYAAVLEKEKMRSKLYCLGVRSGLDQPTIHIPGKWDMASLAVYLFVVSEDGQRASDSLFLEVE